MLFLLPFLFLVLLDYATSFDVEDLPTLVAGPAAARRRRWRRRQRKRARNAAAAARSSSAPGCAYPAN